MDMRYGGTEFICTVCQKDSKYHRIKKRRAFACQHCGHHIYPCVGTPFEKSRTPLTDWFFAMYLFTSTRHGVAAKELERQIGCTYKCAWRMAHELRKLMAQADNHEPLAGHIELDETFVGGVKKGGAKTRGDNKTVVFAMAERDGPVRAGPVSDAGQFTLEPIVLTNVRRGSRISTDGNRAYSDLRPAGYRHESVNHSAGEYVRGIHHVNSLENYFAQLKRGIRGTHIHVSAKHMWKYVSEFSFRRNMRKSHEAMFDCLIEALSLPRLADD
jgi:transposase-like protein/DNA-directed RNA polymerase subunit RPC12/RpoP